MLYSYMNKYDRVTTAVLVYYVPGRGESIRCDNQFIVLETTTYIYRVIMPQFVSSPLFYVYEVVKQAYSWKYENLVKGESK